MRIMKRLPALGGGLGGGLGYTPPYLSLRLVSVIQLLASLLVRIGFLQRPNRPLQAKLNV